MDNPRALTLANSPILTDLPAHAVVLPDPTGVGAFLRLDAPAAADRHVLSLGPAGPFGRFVACHRYEPFWMVPRIGERLSEVPAETQSLLLELPGGAVALLVPLIDDRMRASLQGAAGDTLEVVIESGDPAVTTDSMMALFVAVGEDVYDLMARAASSVMAHLGTGRLRRDKSLPAFVDQFGWCTWDAFYQEVSPEKVRAGLTSFAAGGVSPRLLILDDGWQTERGFPVVARRLTSLAANEKFDGSLAPTVAMARSEFGIETFLVWHAMVGYWGGVDLESLPEYHAQVIPRAFSEGCLAHEPGVQHWWGTEVGVIPPDHIDRFFHDYHDRLRREGVDGVKVDTQAVLEGVSAGLGGRVHLMKRYRQALEGSAAVHFRGNLINCMSNANEMHYMALSTTLTRTSTDFWPLKPATHGLHLFTNAQVSVWFSEFVHPDWDMFQSGHPVGAFHAAARAVSGGPVYVSDKPGEHDFELLRKLVLPDGSVVRTRTPARPTRDCLFRDPLREDVWLKLFSHNAVGAVVGAFHCRYDEEGAPPIHGAVSPSDAETEFLPGNSVSHTLFAVYAHYAGELRVLARDERWEMTLPTLSAELFTIVPIDHGVAPIGLPALFNSGGAVLAQGWDGEGRNITRLRGLGEYLIYCERRPGRVLVDGRDAAYDYDPSSGALRVDVGELGEHEVALN